MNKCRVTAVSIGSIVLGGLLLSPSVFGVGVSGNVELNTRIAASLAMKIASPNDANPDCTPESGVTYGVANRYASSTGDNSGKVVDTFDGREGQADEVNTNTSCATLSMTPNTFSSTYSDVTVFTNSPTGYAVSIQSATGSTPALTNTSDSTLTIPAGALTETNGTVPGDQNKWAYKTDNGIIKNWTAVTTSPVPIKSYDAPTSSGNTTRVTYGISAGNNPTGKYATAVTYTATMFDGPNPYVSKLNITTSENLIASVSALSIPFGQSATVTATPAEGYYLSSVTCPEGFTCTGYETDVSNTSAQTVTVTNGNSENTGTIGLTATQADPWLAAGCESATKDSPCTVNGVQYIKLADGHYWTKENQGPASWGDAFNVCPSGTNLPSSNAFQTLIDAYGGNNGNLYNATSWSGDYWSATEGGSNNSYAYRLIVNSSSARVYIYVDYIYGGSLKRDSHDVACYR